MKKFKALFSLPVILVVILLSSLSLGNQIPVQFKEIAYAISLSIKAGLIFVLPTIIFAYIFKTIATIQRKSAVLLVLFIVTSFCISNFFATWVAYWIGKVVSTQPGLIAGLKVSQTESLQPYWTFSLPTLIANEKALLLGFIAGMIAQIRPNPTLTRFSLILKDAADFFLNRLFIPVVPLFVLGFSLKLQHEGTLSIIAKNYGPVLGLFLVLEVLYIGSIYFVGAGFSFSRVVQMIQTALPSMISAFSTMSSAGTMPLTLKAAEKNTGQPELAQAIVPMTVNNHLIGDALFICLMSLIFMTSFGRDFPTVSEYLPFSIYYTLAMFAMAAVPGGGIIVMLPILEKYLGLNAEILSLMTTLYILFDPINTSANVAGNGAFTVVLARAFTRLKERSVSKSIQSGKSSPLPVQ